jgi:hypothetical protein
MKRAAKKTPATQASIHATFPWRSTSFGNQAEIEALDPATGAWETIALVNAISGLDAEDVASFIVEIVNATRRDA